MARPKKVIETEELTDGTTQEPAFPEELEKVQPAIDNNRNTMIAQRDEYLALLKRLQDEGITNISVLENKIARLNESLK